MKKVLFGIFAHPDDESFGPSATLYKEAQSGTDVHLILLTDGENGMNIDSVENLASIRLKEWQESSSIIGATSNLALHYPDGGLCNNLYLEIAEKIIAHIHTIARSYGEPIELHFMTFELCGITGHLDHVAASFITTYVYVKLREEENPQIAIGKLRYFCLPKAVVSQQSTDWLYMACGKTSNEIDETIDYSDVVEQKLKIMQAHYSQRSDMEKIIATNNNTPKTHRHVDHFCYFKD